jgi:hypothetical protein
MNVLPNLNPNGICDSFGTEIPVDLAQSFKVKVSLWHFQLRSAPSRTAPDAPVEPTAMPGTHAQQRTHTVAFASDTKPPAPTEPVPRVNAKRPARRQLCSLEAPRHFSKKPTYWRGTSHAFRQLARAKSNPDFLSSKPHLFSTWVFHHGDFKWHFEGLPLHRSHA